MPRDARQLERGSEDDTVAAAAHTQQNNTSAFSTFFFQEFHFDLDKADSPEVDPAPFAHRRLRFADGWWTRRRRGETAGEMCFPLTPSHRSLDIYSLLPRLF